MCPGDVVVRLVHACHVNWMSKHCNGLLLDSRNCWPDLKSVLFRICTPSTWQSWLIGMTPIISHFMYYDINPITLGAIVPLGIISWLVKFINSLSCLQAYILFEVCVYISLYQLSLYHHLLLTVRYGSI